MFGRRLILQIVALIKKDFIIIAAHKRTMILELIFPLVMTALSCMFLTVFLREKNIPWRYSQMFPGCNYAAFIGVTPPDAAFNATLAAPCAKPYSGSAYTEVQRFDNWSALYSGFEHTFYQQQPGYQQQQMGLVALEWNDAAQNLTVHDRFLGGSSAAPVVGNIAYSFFHNSTVNTQPSVLMNVAIHNSKVMYAVSAAIMLNFAFFPMASTMAGRLVDEKNAKVREHLRVMGVSSAGYLIAAVCTASVRVMFVALPMLIMIFSFDIVSVSSTLLMWVCFVCFGFSLAGFAQIMPAFFSKSSFSNAAVSLFLAICTLGAPFVSMLPAAAQFSIALLFSPVASVFATAQIFGDTDVVRLPVTPEIAVIFLLLQVVVYGLLSQYLYLINPGEYGVPRSPLFPILDCIAYLKSTSNAPLDECVSTSMKQVDGDASSPMSNATVVLNGLFKYYGSQRDTAAVNDLSLSINQKEIFALLGHNGAGKTTTISILTGMTPSTSYRTATLLGYDVNTQMHLIRQKIGSCPQFDVLFEDLSATQHVNLFAALKGLEEHEHRGQELLKKLKLPDTDQRSTTFSGGMKRRLSVANALVGDSPILFLDEPSSGLDPVSRRQLWELLKDEKLSGKTIILTTHFMEEADYLGDRIAIMSHGQQYCCDTSNNLKQMYGVGYYLKLVKAVVDSDRSQGTDRSREVAQQEGQFNRLHVEKIMSRHNINATFHHESVGDCTYLLPQESLPHFGDLLDDIERDLPSMGASSYGLAMNTLEDVFVSISESEAAKSSKTLSDQHDNLDANHTVVLPCGLEVEDAFHRATHDIFSIVRFFSQVATVMYKKLLFMKRSKRMLFLGVVVPIIMVAIGYGGTMSSNSGGGSGQSYSWGLNENLPDMDAIHIAVVVRNSFTGDSTVTADMKAVMTKWQYYYREMRKKQGFDSHLTFQFITPFEFNTGSFLKMSTISWFTDLNPPLQLLLSDVQLLPESRKTIPLKQYRDGGFAAYTYIFNDGSYSDSFLTMVDPTFRAAMDAVAAQENGPIPNVIVEHFDIPKNMFNSTVPPTPVPTTPAPSVSEPETPQPTHPPHPVPPEFDLVVLAIAVVVAIIQYSANAALIVADELNRKVFHTLRIHGCSAAAYWTGTLLIDLGLGCVFTVAYIIGAFARGVTQIQNMLMAFQVLMIFLTLMNSLLIAYAIVCVLPENVKQSTYIAAVNGFLITLLVFPLIISMAMKDSPTFLDYMTPPRALYYAVYTYHYDHEKIWKMLSSTGSLVSAFVWCIPPAIMLWWYSYVTSLDFKDKPIPATYSNLDGTTIAETTTVPIGTTTPESVSLLTAAAVPVAKPTAEDADVLQEAKRVRDAPDDCMAAAINLRKVYTSVTAENAQSCLGRYFGAKTDKVAVQNLTFGIQAGECFGLLGPNGAGKTTTVKMMLREVMETAGSVEYPYHQHSVKQARDTTYHYARLGCCQQHDTLWDLLTAEEHMKIYLKLRLGPHYDADQWEPYINSAINKVHLEDADGKRAGAFSGGMKRKLAVALALYTGARTVFLDEPSTGMDPYARRALWRSINEALQNDRCVLLTTHSMEEADAVCARIAIMTNGVMRCIGNGQHLKNRFGTGFSITLTLQSPQVLDDVDGSSIQQDDVDCEPKSSEVGELDAHTVSDLETAMKKAFGSSCKLNETLGLQLRFSIENINSLAYAFRTLNENAQSWNLANYAVAQLSSLEQIFINFAGTGAQHGN